jgi:hypothetical protein
MNLSVVLLLHPRNILGARATALKMIRFKIATRLDLLAPSDPQLFEGLF